MSRTARKIASLFAGVLLCAAQLFAFTSPLSETAVREAYFLGQRHNGDYERFVATYIHNFPVPKTGPQVASISFFTPFVQVAKFSHEQVGGFSAQQAQLEYKKQRNLVRVEIQLRLTPAYGPLIPVENGRVNGSQPAFQERSSDFYRDLLVVVLDGKEQITPNSFEGEPLWSCNRDGGCTLRGAALYMIFDAEAFRSNEATITVTPPEGAEVETAFDLSALR